MLPKPPTVAILRPPQAVGAARPAAPPRDPNAPQSLSGADASLILDLDGGPLGAPAEWILRRAFYLSNAALGAAPAFFQQAVDDYGAFIRFRPVAWCHGESRLDPGPRVYRALPGDPLGWWDLQDKLPFEPVATAAGRLLSLRGFDDDDPGLPAAVDQILARMTPWQTSAAENAVDIYERRVDVYGGLGIVPPQAGSAERDIVDEFFVEVVRAVVRPAKAVQTERAYDVSDVRHMAAGGVMRALAWAGTPVLSDRTELESESDAQPASSDAESEAGTSWDGPTITI